MLPPRRFISFFFVTYVMLVCWVMLNITIVVRIL